MRKPFLFAALIAVSACATQVPEGQIVPTKSITSQTSSRPYECFNYNAQADNCEALVKHVTQGDNVTLELAAREAISGIGTINFTITVDFERRSTSYCGDLGKGNITATGGVLPSDIRAQAIRSAERSLKRTGFVCFAYLRSDTGQLYNVSMTKSGDVEGPADRVNFFANPKELRF